METSSTSWVDNKGLKHIRRYVVIDRTVTEACWDGEYDTWILGEFKQPGTGSFVTSWQDGDGIHIRVYVVDLDGMLKEYCYDDDQVWRSSTDCCLQGYGYTDTSWRNGNGCFQACALGSDGDTEVECYWIGSKWVDKLHIH